MALGFVEASEFRQKITPVSTPMPSSVVVQATDTDDAGKPSLDTAAARAAPASRPAESVAEDASPRPTSVPAQANDPSIDHLAPAASAMTQSDSALTNNAAGAWKSENDTGLRVAYLAALRCAILKQWAATGSPASGHCTLTIQQQSGGSVLGAATGDCQLDTSSRLSLEAAALMAQPLTYAEYESVFSEAVSIRIPDLAGVDR